MGLNISFSNFTANAHHVATVENRKTPEVGTNQDQSKLQATYLLAPLAG